MTTGDTHPFDAGAHVNGAGAQAGAGAVGLPLLRL